MKNYLYEIHCHTSQTSKCGRLTGAEIAGLYAGIGYAGIIVTDHFFNGGCAVPPELPWKDRVYSFFEGYRDAKRAGDALGLDVFCGWEYNCNGADFLTYGLDADWLMANGDILSLSPEDYFDRVHRDGGYIVHAHPFRERPYISCFRLFPRYTDAVEVYNLQHENFPQYDERAGYYADSFRLKKLAGSDTHFPWWNGYFAVAFQKKLTGTRDFIEKIKAGSYQCVRTEKNGTPLYLMDEDRTGENCRTYLCAKKTL